MTITIPAKIRQALYIFTAVGTPVVIYLVAKGFIGEVEMALWSAEVLVVGGLAAYKATPEGEIQKQYERPLCRSFQLYLFKEML